MERVEKNARNEEIRKAREEMKRNVNVWCHYKRKEKSEERKKSREDFKKANIEK